MVRQLCTVHAPLLISPFRSSPLISATSTSFFIISFFFCWQTRPPFLFDNWTPPQAPTPATPTYSRRRSLSRQYFPTVCLRVSRLFTFAIVWLLFREKWSKMFRCWPSSRWTFKRQNSTGLSCWWIVTFGQLMSSRDVYSPLLTVQWCCTKVKGSSLIVSR